jgi:hypothetical protein
MCGTEQRPMPNDVVKNSGFLARHQWLTSVILATQEAEILHRQIVP